MVCFFCFVLTTVRRHINDLPYVICMFQQQHRQIPALPGPPVICISSWNHTKVRTIAIPLRLTSNTDRPNTWQHNRVSVGQRSPVPSVTLSLFACHRQLHSSYMYLYCWIITAKSACTHNYFGLVYGCYHEDDG